MSSPTKSRRPATSTSPVKAAANTSASMVSSAVKRSAEIEQRHQLTSLKVDGAHQATTEYLVTQHRELIDDLKADNARLRAENAMLK
jgi:hypothetical protein